MAIELKKLQDAVVRCQEDVGDAMVDQLVLDSGLKEEAVHIDK
jgi:hypothetical protein